MSSAYSRHLAGQSARIATRSASGGGHIASRSGSSHEDLLIPLGLVPQLNDDESSILASPPIIVDEPSRNGIKGYSWGFLSRQMRYVTSSIDGIVSSVNTTPVSQRPFSLRKTSLLLLASFLVGSTWVFSKDAKKLPSQEMPIIDSYVPPIPHPPAGYTIQAEGPHPIQWLRKNTFLDIQELSLSQLQELTETRPKAAFISLIRNEEVDDMVSSIVQIETRFNSRQTHRYDWVFFNNEEFTERFKVAVSAATNSQCHFERIPEEHWSIPPWIDITRFDVGRQFMGGIGVGKAWLQSYHHMCRWNAGIFALEKRLADYDWFWRVEPAVSRLLTVTLPLDSPLPPWVLVLDKMLFISCLYSEADRESHR